MADFCSQCARELLGEDCGDMRGLCGPGEVVSVLCEGCGGTLVDSEGRCQFHEQSGGTSRGCWEAGAAARVTKA